MNRAITSLKLEFLASERCDQKHGAVSLTPKRGISVSDRLLPLLFCVALFATAVLAATPVEAKSPERQRLPQMSCADLATLNLPDTIIMSAEEMPAGPFPFSNTAPTCASDIASPQLPAFCRVVGVIAPQITFEVWLPLENWNRKFEALGNHGFAGNIEYSDMGPELVKGYAVAGTDTGHAGNDPLWMQNEQQIIDYGYRGVHEMTEKSKVIIEVFYGQPARYSYFNGCSTGGKEGLMEAQRYPDDYDGIVVGTPNFAQIHNRAQYVWNAQATFANPETTLSGAKLPLINNATVAACDAIDGIVDGVIDDPRSCPFQPASLLCSFGQDPNTCLTAAQVGALEKVYAGPRNPRTGEEVYPGLVPGSELGWGGHTTGPTLFSTADQFFKFMVYNDPNWDYKTFDFDTDLAYTDANFSHLLDAIDPDLRAFRNHGGKILNYHAWSSTVHTGPRTIEYYEDVVSFLNSGKSRRDFEKTQEFYRLFMAPGGSGSKGPSSFDPLPYLERWVENGIPPKKIIAHHSTNGVVDRTRPLCPYPQVAVYKGSGSTDDAANFVCRGSRGHTHDHDRDD
jgi:feruloyl esterase